LLGQWTTVSRYLNDVLAGEHAAALSADEFHYDYLSERTAAQVKTPVSWFAQHTRLRRRLDTAWTLAALQRGLSGKSDPLRVEGRLAELEDWIESAQESSPGPPPGDLAELEKHIASTLTGSLLARATTEQAGYMVLNPCSFTRRVALELEPGSNPLAVGGQVKACQLDADKLRVVVEVPGLGFTWFPREGPPGTPPPRMRMKMADERTVRNEFLEAEIDPVSGGLWALRDHRTHINRLGQRLVFNPGSTMKASSVKVTSAGPALGEIVTEGELLGEQQQVLATFRQRFRAWLGRPLLDLRIEIYPQQPPAGYPWDVYFGARFAWRDERTVLLRGVNGTSYITAHARPQTPDYLEWRIGGMSTLLFPGGLPFHQRHESRMLDVILVPEGEKCTTFDLALGLDRGYPMQTALGVVTPVPVVATTKGPPHIGATGWLFHLDAPNLLLMGMRPGMAEVGEQGPRMRGVLADAITARLLEGESHAGEAEFRCVRNPRRAVMLDGRGVAQMETRTRGDAAVLEVAPSDLVHLQVEFS
jgi:hypothetical protein